MAKLVTVYGGSGFVGRNVVRILASQGWRVRVAVRRPNEADFLRLYGNVGQVVPVFCNLRLEDSVRTAMIDTDAVVNCVNLTGREGKSTLDVINHEGAATIARLSKELGVPQMVHISGIGVDEDSESTYIATKARGEKAVLEARPDAYVLRPSVIFGAEDQLYNKFAAMSRFGPLLPMAGGKTKVQPVFVEDVAEVAARAVKNEIEPGIYELGGPEVLTMRELVGQVLDATLRRRGVINMPFWLAGIGAGVLDLVETLSLGVVKNKMITRDQLHLLRVDNVVSGDHKSFDDLDITPTAPEAVIEEYLWRYRPTGQYDDIKRSARNLRAD